MKLLKMVATSALLASTLLHADMNKDMRTMLKAMEEIQSAGFYADKDGMNKGVQKLKSGLTSLLSTDAKSYLPDDAAYANKFAKKNAQMITMYADDLIESLKVDRLNDALENYALILKQCTSCHIRLRSY